MRCNGFALSYLGIMKTRLVLTMDPKRVAKLRAVSRRRKISVAALVEHLADRMEASEDATGEDWVEGLRGVITGKISKADLAKDARLAKIMGH
jgi:predicted DNA-binding ribbon-helix-helix protein